MSGRLAGYYYLYYYLHLFLSSEINRFCTKTRTLKIDQILAKEILIQYYFGQFLKRLALDIIWSKVFSKAFGRDEENSITVTMTIDYKG